MAKSPEQIDKGAERAGKPDLITTLDEAESYAEWRREVPDFARSIVEAGMLGQHTTLPPAITPKLREGLIAVQALINNPDQDTFIEGGQVLIKNITRLQRIDLKTGGFVNLFALLASSDVSFRDKLNWYKAHLDGVLNWLSFMDRQEVEDLRKLNLEKEQATQTPTMDEMQESKERLSNGKYEISPYFGGYYAGEAFEHWNLSRLRWEETPREFRAAREIVLKTETERVDTGTFPSNGIQVIDLPYDFAIDPLSLSVPGNVKAQIVQDQDGVFYLHTSSEEQSEIEARFVIGQTKDKQLLSAKTEGLTASAAPLPPELTQKVDDAKRSALPDISKARLLCKFTRDNLKYSMNEELSNQYLSSGANYFSAIWQHKEADCDVANTFASELLRQAGITVRLRRGHYIKGASEQGIAILHGGTGHAWLEVWDTEKNHWVRLDATPKGDPNMDEEEQKEDLSDTPDEGDYGEQDHEVMNEEYLEKYIEEMKEEMRETEVRKQNPEELKIMQFAQEADCSEEEAREIVNAISRIRQIKDRSGKNVWQEAQKVWQQVLKKNVREELYYDGPVTMSEGDDLDDAVSAKLDIDSGEYNPDGFERQERHEATEKTFGGFEVYVLADFSGSMGDVDAATQKKLKDVQKESVFIMVDSMMQFASEMRRGKRTLKSLMPVRVALAVTGREVGIKLPLTETWGPKEQLDLYRVLDAKPNGANPDHEVLSMIQQEIRRSEQQDARSLNLKKNPQSKMHRFVAVFSDGYPDDDRAVALEIASIRDSGHVVYGFGMTASSNKMKGLYAPNAEVVEDVPDLPRVGLEALVSTIKEWYNI